MDELLAARDVGAAIAVARQAGPVPGMKRLDAAVRHLYWQEKDLSRAMILGWAAIHFGLEAAHHASIDADTLRDQARVVAYNLASFGWTGWDEPGIAIDATAQTLALEAARLSLRLVVELGKGEQAISRGHWAVGALWLAEGDRAQSRDAFTRSVEHGQAAETDADARLAEAYLALLDVLDAPGDAAAERAWGQARKRLAVVEHGEDFVEQIDTAHRVFSRTPNEKAPGR